MIINNKKILKSIGKAFIVNSLENQAKAEPKVKSSQPLDTDAENIDKPSEPEPAAQEVSQAAPQVSPIPVVKVPKPVKVKPQQEIVPLDVLITRRRSTIGPYAATLEYSKYKNVPKEFLDSFLRNALSDKPEYIYFLVKDVPQFLYPKILHDSVEDVKNAALKDDKELLDQKKGAIQEQKDNIKEFESEKARVEKLGAKLIRLKKKHGEPKNAKEKKDRKELVMNIKQLKAELNGLISSIEKAEAQVANIEKEMTAPLVALKVTSSIKHTTEDAKILQAASFASWDKDAPELDCRAFLLVKWNNMEVPLIGMDGKLVKLMYRPSSSNGILLAKFTYPYAEEGVWKKILQTGFLQPGDFLIDSTKSLPKSKKLKMPALNDPFYAYVIFTLSLDQIPPLTSENYPSFKLEIKSNLKLCELCNHVSHQTSKCPKYKRKRLSEIV